MKNFIFAALFGTTLLTTACDDGRIYPNTEVDSYGRTAKVSGLVGGLDNWAEGYTVALAGFAQGSDYATISKAIMADGNGQVDLTLANIPNEVNSLQICVLDKLRRLVVSFKTIDIQPGQDIRADFGSLDVSMMNAIQVGFFSTTCANCHGASNHAAAGLDLTEGKAYAALVGVDSRRVEGRLLVSPGDAENSVLRQVLHQQQVEGISMNHFDLVSEKNAQSILPLIDSWIENGAK